MWKFPVIISDYAVVLLGQSVAVDGERQSLLQLSEIITKSNAETVAAHLAQFAVDVAFNQRRRAYATADANHVAARERGRDSETPLGIEAVPAVVK